MKNLIRIKEGTTYDYLPHGFAFLVVGMIFLAVHWSIAVVFMLLAIAIIGIKTGVEVDIENRQIRKYKQFLGIYFGQYKSLKSIVLAKLVMNQFNTKFAVPVRNLAWREKQSRMTTYNLILIDDTETETIFNQFVKFSLADKTLKALSKIDSFETFNEVAAVLKKQRSNRRH
jgi:hypothetical protein